MIEEIVRRFELYVSGDETCVNANIRGVVFATALKHSKNLKSDFEAVKNIYLTSHSVETKLTALSSLGATKSTLLAHDLLMFTLESGLVKPQDVIRPIASLVNLNPHKTQILEMLWQWCTENWETLHEQLSATISLLGGVLKTCISSQVGLHFIDEVKAWARGDDCSSPEAKGKRIEQLASSMRLLEQGLERVHGITVWVEKENQYVLKWAHTDC